MTSYRVGAASITRIEEVLEPGFTPAMLFPGIDMGVFDAHPQLRSPQFFDAATGRVRSSIHGWLIRLDGRTILVDTCSGNQKPRQLPMFARFHMLNFPFMENLAQAGVAPDDVDIVFCTHLHIDHVGWNTRKDGDRWIPAFPKARYVFGRAEYAHWREGGEGRRLFPANIAVIEDSVDPVVEAGLVDCVEAGDEIAPGLRAEAAPGHTATQLALRYAGADGASFVCCGDVLHQPIQIYAPDLNSCFCEDGVAARATRRALLERAAHEGTLILPMHFGPPHAGYVRRAGDGFRFEPATPVDP